MSLDFASEKYMEQSVRARMRMCNAATGTFTSNGIHHKMVCCFSAIIDCKMRTQRAQLILQN